MKHASTLRLLLLGLLLGLTVLTQPGPAQACSAPFPSVRITGWTGAREVPMEGVIVMHATREGSASLPELVVRDAEERTVAGTLDTTALRPVQANVSSLGVPGESQPVLLVWRSDAPLTSGQTYSLEFAQPDFATEVETFMVVASEAVQDVPTEQPMFDAPVATRGQVSAGLELSCDDVTDEMGPGACPVCGYTDYVDAVAVSVSLPETSVDSLTLHRLVPEAADAVTRDGILWAGSEDVMSTASGALYFLDEVDTYCFHVESENLLDGSTLVGPRTCVSAPDVAADPTTASGCSAAPGRSGGGWPAWVLAGALLYRRRRS